MFMYLKVYMEVLTQAMGTNPLAATNNNHSRSLKTVTQKVETVLEFLVKMASGNKKMHSFHMYQNALFFPMV